MSAIIRALAACLAIAPLACGAVSLDPQGVGQALIFPYYTVRSTDGNAFNTFVSIANSSADAKALRVRFREGRNSREVASFNLFLAPGGIWTGALVPSGDGARLVSADQSCTSPAFASAPGSLPFLDFSDASYAGANADGAGTGLDRTREGYVEAIEMATLTGASAQQAAFTGTSLATPANCGALRNAATLETAAPSGGLSGTLTVINVDAGRDFTVNADALANLASRPFYRPIADPYPDFDVTEVDAYSTGIVEGKVYRATWSRGVDAVSSALIASVIENEFVIDAATRSRTDWIVTLPTRRFYGSGTTVAAPFSPPFSDTACPSQEVLLNDLFNREIAFLPVDTAGAFGAPSAPPVAAASRCRAARWRLCPAR